MKKKRENTEKREVQGCFECRHFIALGEGGHLCDVCGEVLTEDYEPTEYFYFCRGKDFER